ncbi:DHH family phosphoesterase [archaeon]|jgi:single-stranded DNA-specific DHH superfamily exonuclease|nr:DHH family phosphoesterase [archaeon]
MIPEKQIKELREYLSKAENPLFFYDDDPDGVCSYLLLKKYVDDRGKGIIVKSVPTLEEKFVRKVKEYCPDLVVVLDMPDISQDFIDQVHVPIVWLDHHGPVERKGVHYYNPRLTAPKDNKPTSYYAYKVTKQNLWLATLGTTADWYYPNFAKEFATEYPDLLSKKVKKPETVLYDTKLGELVKIVSFLLKGDMKDVRTSIHLLSQMESPYEILNQTSPKGKWLYKRAMKFQKEYDVLLADALKTKAKGKLLLYYYPSTKNAFTSEISNEILYKNPTKVTIIARESSGYMKLSFRSTDIKLPKLIEKAMDGLDGYGGGHEHACGGNLNKDDFDEFIERFRALIEK